MSNVISSAARVARRTPLAACIASIFALAAPVSAIADTCVVNSCDGDLNTPGTLRSCIANAPDTGRVVDLSGLVGVNACADHKIKLSTSGEIVIQATSVTISGPGADLLAIDGALLPPAFSNNNARPLTHVGTGTLALSNIGVSGGHVAHDGGAYQGRGGCIYSSGNVTLTDATVSSCTAATSGVDIALGGGVFTKGNLTLTNSTVSGNSVSSGGASIGGGAYVAGDLTLNNSTLSGNSLNAISDARGGGAYVNGISKVQLNSVVYDNHANSSGANAHGGGIYAKGDLTLDVSTIKGNTAGGFFSKGGGARVIGNFTSNYSSVSYNSAYGAGFGGGLFLQGSVNKIKASTISGNLSAGRAGGVDVQSLVSPGANYFGIANSTISNNFATTKFGGLYVNSGTVKFFNSTIAFNTAVAGSPGVELNATSASMAVTLKSTLMSNNTYGADFQNDLKTTAGIHTITFNGSNPADAANNLIRVPSILPTPDYLPTDTLIGDCPHLGKLRNNGGLTLTHALQSKSIAINAGNDVFGAPFDQRGSLDVNGTLDYTRYSGDTALADIGAYEVQQNDVVFNNDLEDCPAPPI
jgi:predicted outer membrane repeat protein